MGFNVIRDRVPRPGLSRAADRSRERPARPEKPCVSNVGRDPRPPPPPAPRMLPAVDKNRTVEIKQGDRSVIQTVHCEAPRSNLGL